MMTYGLRKPSEIPLQQRALHEMAKICWGKFVLRDSISSEIHIPETTKLLIAYRDKVLNRVPQILSARLPKILIDKVIKAVFSLQQGYKEALLWEEKYQYALPTTILNPFTAGQYQAGNFIDPTGHFKDLAWAKYFTNEANENMPFQIQIACFYGLEEAIIDMWQIFITYKHVIPTFNNYPHVTCEPHVTTNPCEPCQKLLQIESNPNTRLVAHWFTELRNNFDILVAKDNSYHNNVFHVRGIWIALILGHEYAARFFWTRLTDVEKQWFQRDLNLELIAKRAENNHVGLVYFCYSLLPKTRICDLILSDFVNQERLGTIWSCLLDSPYYESVLEDAQNFLIPSSQIYCILFASLVLNIKEAQNPFHADILKILWNCLEEELQKQVLEMNFNIIFVLIEIRRIDLLEIIIQSLSRDVKENILLNDWGSAGRSALSEFSKIGDYDSMLRYLLCFLIDRNSRTQKISFRIDPINFFNCYIKKMVAKWTQTVISQSAKNEVENIMNILDRTLNVTNMFLEKVAQERCIEMQ